VKLGTPRNSSGLHPQNMDQLVNLLGKKDGYQAYQPLLTLVADMFDQIANGEDMYMTIGATRKKDAYVLTVKWNQEGTPIYAESLLEMAAKAEEML